jgi:hypothetical protein
MNSLLNIENILERQLCVKEFEHKMLCISRVHFAGIGGIRVRPRKRQETVYYYLKCCIEAGVSKISLSGRKCWLT